MKFPLYCLLIAIYSVISSKGLGAVQFIDPPSGSTIADFEGTVNFTTITCSILNSQGTQLISTQWFIANFRRENFDVIDDMLAPELFLFSGDPIPAFPTLDYRNRLTILTLSPDLDRVTIFCGSGTNQRQGSIIIRIYRPPILRDNFLVRIQEGNKNVPIDLSLDPAAFPEPTNFSWNVNGQSLTGLPQTYSYSRVNFSTVRRSHAGNYAVFAANYLLNDPTVQVGNDSGSFYLDVLYSPSFVTEGPTQRYVLLGDRLSLVCGTGLNSNPQATITWTAPDGTTIVDNARYDLENGSDIVRLNFTNTVMSDTGVWRCVAYVTSERHIVSGGRLVLQDHAVIGSISVNIQIIIIAPPGQPGAPSVENIGATWASISWTAPFMAASPISHYEIIAREMDGKGIVTMTTFTSSTFLNVSGLLPGTTYNLTVIAVSEGGDVIARSAESAFVILTTGVTVPNLTCSEPVSIDGVIRVSWFYVHTGGLPLTDASVEYSYMSSNGSSLFIEPISVSETNTTVVEVSNLVAGFSYTFIITAENSNGSSTTLCRSILHTVGVPFMPEVGALVSGPSVGQVTLQIKTVASGISSSVQDFQFIVTPVLDGRNLSSIQYSFPDYQSGVFVSVSVSGLEKGKPYIFCVMAMNTFGTSKVTKSSSVIAGVETQMTVHNVGAITGGVVGALLVVIMIVILVIIFVITLLNFYRKATVRSEAEVVYEDPDSVQQYIPKKDENIELKECPAYGESREKHNNLDLSRCPAYGVV